VCGNLNYHSYHVMATMAWKVDELWHYFYFNPTYFFTTFNTNIVIVASWLFFCHHYKHWSSLFLKLNILSMFTHEWNDKNIEATTCNRIVTQIKHAGQQCTTFCSPSIKSNLKFSERKRFHCFLVSDITIGIIFSWILMYFIYLFYVQNLQSE
jgi:hypothetical protein